MSYGLGTITGPRFFGNSLVEKLEGLHVVASELPQGSKHIQIIPTLRLEAHK